MPLGRVILAVVSAACALAGCSGPGEQPDGGPRPAPAASTVGGAWQGRASAPVRLSEVGGAAWRGRIWTAGGLTSRGAAATTVQVYDPASDSWSAGPALPAGVHHASLVAGDRLYLIGGYKGGFPGGATAEVWVLEESGRRWAAGPALPEPRAAGAGAWDGRRLVYGGGVGPRGVSGDVLALEDGRWRTIGALSRPREHLGAAGDGRGRVWFLGGRTGGLDTNLADADLVTGGRVARIGALPTPRGGVAAFHAGRLGACLAGGERDAATHAEVECVDTAGRATRLPPLGRARHGIAAATGGGFAYVLLGGPEPRLAVSGTVERLRLP